jgi:hypothetical protein
MSEQQRHTTTLALATLAGAVTILEFAIHPHAVIRLLDHVPVWAILAFLAVTAVATVLAVSLARAAHLGDQAMRLALLREKADRERGLR